MKTEKLIRPTLLRVGWISLFVGLLIPFSASIAAIVFFWNLPCTTEVVWTFAPLLLGCGPMSPTEEIAGWTATAATLASLCLALALAITSLTREMARPHLPHRFSALTFGSTAVVALAAAAVVAALNPDSSWGTNSWVFFSSATALITAVLIATALASYRALTQHRRPPSR